MAISKPFTYSPLPTKSHIRLLWIQLNPRDGSLSFKLRHHPLEALPKYHALSYVWGTSIAKEAIICDEQRMWIGENLHKALHNIYAPQVSRKFDLSRVLSPRKRKVEVKAPLPTEFPIWIDAICINQQDNDEKNDQVQRMGDIYKNASLVLIWLGHAEHESDLAMEMIPDLAKKMEPLPRGFPADQLYLHQIPDKNHPFWRALGHLFQRKWFARLWTFQEAVLAREILVICGRKTVSWEAFSSVAVSIIRLVLRGSRCNLQAVQDHEDGFLSTLNITQTKKSLTGNGTMHLVAFLDVADRKLVTDPRDKVYGVLGLCKKSMRDSITILYDKSGDEGTVTTYIDCVRACLEESMFVLELVAGRSRLQGLPSWCPNFMASRKGRALFGLHLMAGIARSDDQPLRRSAKISPESHILHVAGFRVDTVDEIIEVDYGFPGLQHETLQGKCRKFLAWELSCLKLAKKVYKSKGAAIPHGHLFTLTSNTRARLPERADNAMSQAYHDRLIHARSLADSSQNHPPLDPDRLANFHEFWEHMDPCRGRRYFSTKGGRTGLGPIDMKVGDVVCVLYDAITLFVLRPAVKEKNGWFLVGDAYVYGLMELSETLKGETGDDEVFDIS